jgi:hypothetical protein
MADDKKAIVQSVKLPPDIRLALLKLNTWCRENGYTMKIFKK